MKRLKEQGITLLALAITVIIMLILAGITLNAALGDHGIIKEAKSTVDDYEKAQEDEQSSLEAIRKEIAKNRKKEVKVSSKIIDSNGNEVTERQDEGTKLKIQLELTKDDDIEITSVKDKNGNIINGDNLIYTSEDITSNGEYVFIIGWNLNGTTQPDKEQIVKVDQFKISYIGKYVKYEPDKATYSKNLLKANYTGSSSNSNNFTTEEYTGGWQIMDYNEETGEMTIVMAQPTKNLYLADARGYNNGVDILNDICAKLFSKKTGGWNVEARSMKIEDVENRLNTTWNIRKNIFGSGTSYTQYGQTYESGFTKRKYPTLYANEIGGDTDGNGIKTTGIERSERNPNISYNSSDIQYGEKSYDLMITQTYREYSIKNYLKNVEYEKIFSNDINYWIASRCVDVWVEDVIHFNINVVKFGTEMFSDYLYEWDGSSHDFGEGIRAVVELGQGIKVNTTNSGLDKDHPYEISK